MAIEYLGLSGIKGPLVVLENVKNASYDEIVEFTLDNDPKKKLGRIIELYEDKAVIQVFEGSENMSLLNTHTKLTGKPMSINLSLDILGRTFNAHPACSAANELNPRSGDIAAGYFQCSAVAHDDVGGRLPFASVHDNSRVASRSDVIEQRSRNRLT